MRAYNRLTMILPDNLWRHNYVFFSNYFITFEANELHKNFFFWCNKITYLLQLENTAEIVKLFASSNLFVYK